jgi:hypothetical protein
MFPKLSRTNRLCQLAGLGLARCIYRLGTKSLKVGNICTTTTLARTRRRPISTRSCFPAASPALLTGEEGYHHDVLIGYRRGLCPDSKALARFIHRQHGNYNRFAEGLEEDPLDNTQWTIRVLRI